MVYGLGFGSLGLVVYDLEFGGLRYLWFREFVVYDLEFGGLRYLWFMVFVYVH